MAASAPFLSLNLILWEVSRAKFAAVMLQKFFGRLAQPLLILLPTAVLALSMLVTFSLPRRLLRGETFRESWKKTRTRLRGKGKWNVAGAVLV